MNLRNILYEKRDGIAWVQFNRPDKLNALDSVMLGELGLVLEDCEEDDSNRVLVLMGDQKSFMAGADIEHMAKADIKFAYSLTDSTMRIQERLADLSKPTIAAIRGYALGAGCGLALCCDFRIAADNSILGLPEINLGIIPGGGGTQRLPRLVGFAAANRIIPLGEMIKAGEAQRIGLVDQVLALDGLKEEVEALASRLIEKPSIALRAAKTAMRKGFTPHSRIDFSWSRTCSACYSAQRIRRKGWPLSWKNESPNFREDRRIVSWER